MSHSYFGDEKAVKPGQEEKRVASINKAFEDACEAITNKEAAIKERQEALTMKA